MTTQKILIRFWQPNQGTLIQGLYRGCVLMWFWHYVWMIEICLWEIIIEYWLWASKGNKNDINTRSTIVSIQDLGATGKKEKRRKKKEACRRLGWESDNDMCQNVLDLPLPLLIQTGALIIPWSYKQEWKGLSNTVVHTYTVTQSANCYK